MLPHGGSVKIQLNSPPKCFVAGPRRLFRNQWKGLLSCTCLQHHNEGERFSMIRIWMVMMQRIDAGIFEWSIHIYNGYEPMRCLNEIYFLYWLTISFLKSLIKWYLQYGSFTYSYLIFRRVLIIIIFIVLVY
jgi:hypothetical protein